MSKNLDSYNTLELRGICLVNWCTHLYHIWQLPLPITL